VKNIVVAGIKFPSFEKKIGKLHFNTDTLKQFNFEQNNPRIEISTIVYFHLHLLRPSVFALRESFLPTT